MNSIIEAQTTLECEQKKLINLDKLVFVKVGYEHLEALNSFPVLWSYNEKETTILE